MSQKYGKFQINPEDESWMAKRFPDCGDVFVVDSACAVAGPIFAEVANTTCSRDKVLHAVRVGSLYAHDLSFYWDGNPHRGGAVRIVTHTDTIRAWAYDDATAIATNRQMNAAARCVPRLWNS